MKKAFESYSLAGRELKNRIVMGPMTRTRTVDTIPTAMTAEYYAQRAGAGLIITEGTHPSIEGQGYPDTPGLHQPAQLEGWQKVTEAVHEAGGVIYAQLMHVGRIGDPDLLPRGHELLAPSAVPAKGQIYTHAGMKDYSVPKTMTEEDIQYVIGEHVKAARNAIDAGFDGVEIHGANGYLLQQFLSSNANVRTDQWGKSPAGRIRFGLAVAEAVSAEIGPERVGFRISPGNPLHDIEEVQTEEMYELLVKELNRVGLGYLHIAEGPDWRNLVQRLADIWEGTLILNPGTIGRPTGPEELAVLEATSADGTKRLADMVCYAANFISNPDLPYRLEHELDLTEPRREFFYGIGPEGYTDYPISKQQVVQAEK